MVELKGSQHAAGLFFLDIKGDQALHALRIIRSFVRGFVLHEAGASFLEPLEYDQTYERGVRVFIEGLQVLKN